jgi:sphingomyelin phosphodiesterase
MSAKDDTYFIVLIIMYLLRWVYLASLLGGALASPSKSLAKRSTVSDILADIENAVTCSACEVSPN